MKLCPGVLAFLFLVQLIGFADNAPPVDENEYWTVGITAFEGVDLSQENRYLANSFPLILRERLEAIPAHYFSESQAAGYRRAIIRKEQRLLAKQIQTYREQRDELFFTEEFSQEAVSDWDEKIEQGLARLSYLRDLDPVSIEMPESKPLRFKSGPEGELLFDKSIRSPLQLAREQQVELLLWGSFEEIQGYLYLEVRALDAVLTRELFSYRDAASFDGIYEIVDDIVAELATVLWGRDWASLSIETVPPGALVWIDGSFRGRAPLQLPYLLPGERKLRVDSPGYQSSLLSVFLSPYEAGKETVVLIPAAAQTIDLESEPSGVPVYSGSQWLGTTPLKLDKSDEAARILLRKDGYLDFPLYTDAKTQSSVSVSLVPEAQDPAEVQKRRRDEFYTSFGIFALSLPLPIFLWGYTNDCLVGAQAALDEANISEANRYIEIGKGCYYGYLGTTAVSVTLFAYMMYRLVRFIRTADRKA